MRFIICCDSFKGTMTSHEVGLIIENSIKQLDQQADVKRLIISDGGEGMLEALTNLIPGKRIMCDVHNAWFEQVSAPLFLTDDEKTIYIEMAQAAGYHLKDKLDQPGLTTTLGVGELMKKALDYSAEKIVIGCGGSATNDGGAGMMHALGVRFYNYHNQEFIPTGVTLSHINRIDFSHIDKRVKEKDWVALTDVSNPLYGKNGATYIYAPQKGATPAMVEKMESGMIHYASLISQYQAYDVSRKPGMGAAGGLSYGLHVLLNAKIKSGIDEILDISNLDHIVHDYDYMILGEGSLDEQSLQGKAVIGIARRYQHKIKKVVIVGQVLGDQKRYLDEGIDVILETNEKHLPFEEVKNHAKEDLKKTFEKWLKNMMKKRLHHE